MQSKVARQACKSGDKLPTTGLGPTPPSMTASWMVNRLQGVPFDSARLFVEANGNIVTRDQP